MENSQILQNIGKTKTDKLINEITSEYFELKKKTIPFSKNEMNFACVVSVIKQNEIKSIGMSCLNDLILDNYGIWIKHCIFRNGSSEALKNIFGSSSTYLLLSVDNNAYNTNASNSPCGSQVQVGSNTTPALRSDFQIISPFANGGIEDNPNNTGTGAFLGGVSRVFVPSTISPTIGGGIIAEAILIQKWRKSVAGFTDQIAISRDNISPVVQFFAGDTINIDYTIQL